MMRDDLQLQEWQVPYKHSESRSHKFTKPNYKVTNWPGYDDAPRRRGDFSIWFTEDAITDWCPLKLARVGAPKNTLIMPLGGHLDSSSVPSAAL
jgi:hypothetical protein